MQPSKLLVCIFEPGWEVVISTNSWRSWWPLECWTKAVEKVGGSFFLSEDMNQDRSLGTTTAMESPLLFGKLHRSGGRLKCRQRGWSSSEILNSATSKVERSFFSLEKKPQKNKTFFLSRLRTCGVFQLGKYHCGKLYSK